MMSGLLIVDKPPGWTSHDVVGRLRRLAGTKKVGHAGTLDPMATGVLVVGVNRATRLLGHLMLTEKAYDATIRLGVSTVTDDDEGEVTARTTTGHLDRESIAESLHAFVGEISQVPSSVSAIKVDGKRSYARVRAGEDVVLAPRQVTVSSLDLRSVALGDDGVDVHIGVTCSSGTYIRAIARDLGDALGVGGHLTALRRTRVGEFGLDDARTLDQLATELDLIDIDEVARRTFETFDLTAEQADHVTYGRSLDGVELPVAGRPHALFAPDGRFLALYEQHAGSIRAVAVFANR